MRCWARALSLDPLGSRPARLRTADRSSIADLDYCPGPTMTPTEWEERAASISPLLAFAERGTWGGETGVMEKIFSLIPPQDGFGVEFGQRSMAGGTLSALVERHGWGALYMDVCAASDLDVRSAPGGRSITLAKERVTPGTINALFEKHAVPPDLDCLVIDIDGLDYWVWEAVDAKYSPSLVIIEFNAHVGHGVEATIQAQDDWVYKPSKNYGASFAALCSLARSKGYRLVHVHGPWNLYFLRQDLALPADLTLRWPVSQQDLALLTRTEDFYDSLCGKGKRPTWINAEAPDVSRAPWEILSSPQASQVVDLDGLPLDVMANKTDPNWYLQRTTLEEKASLLYSFIREEQFVNFVDIGANVGLISILAKRAAPALRILAVEADPRLAKLIRRNFALHRIEGAQVVNAVVGSLDCEAASFSLNPSSTLDNRVDIDGWQKTAVPMIAVDTLLSRTATSGKTFFKIDTQGFELSVLRGMEATLENNRYWVLKMEFAPNWLLSQGTDPLVLLDYLQERYQFAEFPERIPFGTPDTDALFRDPVQASDHAGFLDHVISLNKSKLGWVDLVVRPKPARS